MSTVTVYSSGSQGPIGVNWRDDINGGAWLTGTAFAVRDAVRNGSPASSYRCILAHTSGAASEPGVGGSWQTYWKVLSERGGTGSQGQQGIQGEQGIQGIQGLKGDSGDAYETYGVSIYKSDGIALGGYYAERSASAGSTQTKLFAEIIAGDVGADVEFYVEIDGAPAYGPVTAAYGAPVDLSGLSIAVDEGDAVSFVIIDMSGNVTDFFAKTYGAVS